ncbi:hypothetical protein ACOBV8_18485 (plasmid) [Pseudoalteromonas espejiana]
MMATVKTYCVHIGILVLNVVIWLITMLLASMAQTKLPCYDLGAGPSVIFSLVLVEA